MQRLLGHVRDFELTSQIGDYDLTICHRLNEMHSLPPDRMTFDLTCGTLYLRDGHLDSKYVRLRGSHLGVRCILRALPQTQHRPDDAYGSLSAFLGAHVFLGIFLTMPIETTRKPWSIRSERITLAMRRTFRF